MTRDQAEAKRLRELLRRLPSGKYGRATKSLAPLLSTWPKPNTEPHQPATTRKP